ncbi:MAG: hypothetical protein R2847_03030 [Bacteroidia bacterium]
MTIASCSQSPKQQEKTEVKDTTAETEIMADRFADIQLFRYTIPGWQDLNLQQKACLLSLHGRNEWP